MAARLLSRTTRNSSLVLSILMRIQTAVRDPDVCVQYTDGPIPQCTEELLLRYQQTGSLSSQSESMKTLSQTHSTISRNWI